MRITFAFLESTFFSNDKIIGYFLGNTRKRHAKLGERHRVTHGAR